MKRLIKRLSCATAAMLIAAAGAANAQESSTEASGAPRAVVPLTSYHFGDINRGEIISQIFTIKNTGDAELKIKEIVAGCGCETVGSDKTIAPGQEGNVRIEINTMNQMGGIVRPVTVRTNDPNQPDIVFTLTANVLTGLGGGSVQSIPVRAGKHIGPVFVGPSDFLGLTSLAGQKGKTEFTVAAERGPVKLVRVEGGDAHIAARVETVEEGKSYKIVVESVPTDAPGIYEEHLRVITDSAALQSFPVTVRLNVLAKQ
ncbi:MAG TPA: DUF1573 domain-containing protein [Blastocatellia bacterium]|nr:DUF1573 domain-containing protein [Blastocatellia bacterium]